MLVMTVEKLQAEFILLANPQNAQAMAAYMQNKAPFLGINKPQRVLVEKPFISSWAKLPIVEILSIAKELVVLDYREYLYTAQQLLLRVYAKLSPDDIRQLLEFALINPWWDNIDGWVMVIRRWSAKDLTRAAWLVKCYASDENMWLRRMSIICQINHKATEYDEQVLFAAITANLWDKEFFIQKAIGWALRDYSEKQPQTVLKFVEKHRDVLSKLAIREATRKIN